MGVEWGPAAGLGRRAWRWSVSGGLAVVLLLGTLSCGTGGPAGPAPGSARGAQPVSLPADCTARVVEPAALQRALREAKPGARVCVTGDLGAARLDVAQSGAPGRPIEVFGDGRSTVGGITINADHVAVRGFTSVGGAAPGIWLKGTDVTVENNTVRHPTGDDFDGIRFFGTDLRIVHNTIIDINPTGGDGPSCIQTKNPPPDPSTPGVVLTPETSASKEGCDAHADCLQTFATGPDGAVPDTGPSRQVRIEGNSCQRVDGHCLIAQGPHSRPGTGSGQGESSDITFVDNYCDAHASQAVLVDDVRNVVIRGNEIDSTDFESSAGLFKAFAFANNSTDGTVEANQLSPNVGYEVAMDNSSRAGYRGPSPVGIP
jgi:hypothetical protein